MNKEDTIKKAQEVARLDYDNSMKKINCHNPNLPPRKWNKSKLETGEEAYSLEGTPDKAFVIVRESKVYAIRQDHTIIQEFTIE